MSSKLPIKEKFYQSFSIDNLKFIFSQHIIYSGATGIDQLNQYSFRSQLDDQVEILSRKIINGTYRFTKYKLKLISKGKGKNPREISIPTIRDRIALRVMCDFLMDIYNGVVKFELPQQVIRKVKSEEFSNKYDAVIKLDVSNFYPSVNHQKLISKLGRKIRDRSIKDIFMSAISTPAVSFSKASDEPTARGIPQGLAVSNILAAVYLLQLDDYLCSLPHISYFRYVDDVLILCKRSSAELIAHEVIDKFKKLNLKVYDPIKNPEKSKIGLISGGFDYLGYQFLGADISARRGSVDKLKESLVSIFTNYKYSKIKNEKFLEWRLNLRITGCVFEQKGKGWLFFFSEINDEKLLHVLDNYVNKLVLRFGVKIQVKKFVRAFKELNYKKYETNYIPNFDRFDLDQKKSVLTTYFGMNLKGVEDEEIEFQFRRRLAKQVKDMLSDVGDFS